MASAAGSIERAQGRTPAASMMRILVALLFFLFFGGLIAAPLAAGYVYGWKPSETEYWLGAAGVIASALSLAVIAASLLFQQRQLLLQHKQLNSVVQSHRETIAIHRCMYDQRVLSAIEEFFNKDLQGVRDACARARLKWKSDRSGTSAAFKKLFVMQITDEWGTIEEHEQHRSEHLFEEYAAITRLGRFFDMISHYDISPTCASALSFYYIWWRGFLKEVAATCVAAFEEVDPARRHLPDPPNWVFAFDRLDEKVLRYTQRPADRI